MEEAKAARKHTSYVQSRLLCHVSLYPYNETTTMETIIFDRYGDLMIEVDIWCVSWFFSDWTESLIGMEFDVNQDLDG